MLQYQPCFLSVSLPSAAADGLRSQACEPTIYFVFVVCFISTNGHENCYSPLSTRAFRTRTSCVAGVLMMAASLVAGAMITPSNLERNTSMDGKSARAIM